MDSASLITVFAFVISTAAVTAIPEGEGKGPLDQEDDEIVSSGDDRTIDDLFNEDEDTNDPTSGDDSLEDTYNSLDTSIEGESIDDSPKLVVSELHPKKNSTKIVRVPQIDFFLVWLGIGVGVIIAMTCTVAASILMYRRRKLRALIEARNKEIAEEYTTPLGYKMPTRAY